MTDKKQTQSPAFQKAIRQINAAKARKAYQTMKANGSLPNQHQAFTKHPTPLKAIRLFCLNCQAGSRKEVKQCNDTKCYLWLFRTKNINK